MDVLREQKKLSIDIGAITARNGDVKHDNGFVIDGTVVVVVGSDIGNFDVSDGSVMWRITGLECKFVECLHKACFDDGSLFI